MQTGLKVQRTSPVAARLLARTATEVRRPGHWVGADGQGRPVTEDELADLVSRFGAEDVVGDSTPDEAAAYASGGPDQRLQLRQRLERAAEVTAVHAFLQRHEDPGCGLLVAQFFHEYDDQTCQPRPHTHTIVLAATAAATAATAAAP